MLWNCALYISATIGYANLEVLPDGPEGTTMGIEVGFKSIGIFVIELSPKNTTLGGFHPYTLTLTILVPLY